MMRKLTEEELGIYEAKYREIEGEAKLNYKETLLFVLSLMFGDTKQLDGLLKTLKERAKK